LQQEKFWLPKVNSHCGHNGRTTKRYEKITQSRSARASGRAWRGILKHPDLRAPSAGAPTHFLKTEVQPFVPSKGYCYWMDEFRELIDGCVRGEKRWQDRLYKKFGPVLYGICLRYAKNRMEAEDVLQEVFVKIYQHIKSYHYDGSFEGWLRRIAVNTSITHYRRNLKHAYQEDVDEVIMRKDDPLHWNDAEFTQEEMMGCIEKLPHGYKTVFNLYVMEGMMHKEIAEMLEIDVNTSKSQLSRAKMYLQRELAEISKIKL
jgi:RNA polymerase sigma factor (sigma-70 family)